MKCFPRRLLYVAAAALGVVLVLVALPLQSAPADPHVATSGPRSPEEERRSFHVPEGFEVQLVAAEPYVRKPININFDARGRLWVTESVEYPFPAKEGVRHRDSVRILEDTNGDGLADEVTTFASGLNIPIGVLPLSKGAMVFSIPNISLFHDRDGDNRADGREVLYQTYGYGDTHGMTGEFTWGFDGWIYACHGFQNTSTVRAKDGSTITMQSGNVYRIKPDGSRVEQFTHGQVNPFGLAFDPLGNLFSCDCHSRPIYQLLRGAWYPSFGKPHDGLGFGPEMMRHDHGSTGIAGIAYYAADHFPPAYRGTVFVGNPITNRINHDRIEWTGATPRAVQLPDFMRSDDPWFRPVDIKLGPDGALYVADFYNRIIGHYEVPLTHPGRDRERGRIWRIVYRGTKEVPVNTLAREPRTDWTRATVAELLDDLAHPNLSVRMISTNQLVERGVDAVPAVRMALNASSSPVQRVHLLWALERWGQLSDNLLTAAARDNDRGVRVHAQSILAERKSLATEHAALVLEGVHDKDPLVKRAAADALARHPATANMAPLLQLLHMVPAVDTHLRHVVRMALREQFRSDATWKELAASLTTRDAQAVADICPGVPSAAAANFLVDQMKRNAETRAPRLDFVQHCARYLPEERLGELLAIVRERGSASDRVGILKAFLQGTQTRGRALRDDAMRWAESLTRKLLDSPREQETLSGLELCGSLKLESSRPILIARSTDKKLSEAQRNAAMAALVALEPRKAVSTLSEVLTDAANPPAIRDKGAQLLGGINRPEAHDAQLKALAAAPGRLQVTLAAGLVGNTGSAEKLLKAVEAGKASPRLLQERIVELRLARLNMPNWRERVGKLTQGLPAADQRVQQLFQSRRMGFESTHGEAARGLKVYEKHCAICHPLANKGAKIGPQLDGIGIRGLDRLLEDILDPNRNVDQAFRLTTLNLNNGQVISGLLLREQGAVLVMANAQGQEVNVPKETVEERAVSQMSPMPANFVDQVSEADFYDLLAYLLEQKPKN